MSRAPSRGRRLVSLLVILAGLALTVGGVAVATETALELLLLASGRSLGVPGPSVRHGAVGVAAAVAGYTLLSAGGGRDDPDAAADDGDATTGTTRARGP
ncbi:hypothetical protein C475_06055 [Halosimplex carlsbadense 2-9-1]|uniref:Uncharacterized protein n=1 Tax=Halosimplex carlsbadense 2-9-1 TaxID=797114 RepID=M0CZZ8_9EURY|nr:hypothetical protein [Halosimplex carlsbadense]ELZ27459.1 hypothetical protein C475_06055 [Halosimplex carlsbadense 2-9-1]